MSRSYDTFGFPQEDKKRDVRDLIRSRSFQGHGFTDVHGFVSVLFRAHPWLLVFVLLFTVNY